MRLSAPREHPDFFEPAAPPRPARDSFAAQLREFKDFGADTLELPSPYRTTLGEERQVPMFVNEYWTAGQRQAHSLHEVSYRACFKPQLPRFFIERLTRPGDLVYDPFMGRGTTLLEAALLDRAAAGNDVNPLSAVLIKPRLAPPEPAAIEARLARLPLEPKSDPPEDLLVFYHPDTLREIVGLKEYFLERAATGQLDAADEWIRMVSINRLTGHSPGFFSVYTLPPNQATSVKAQRRINERRQQTPPRRDVKAILHKKSRQLLKDLDAETRAMLQRRAASRQLFTGLADATAGLAADSVALVVTSPPFLDIVNYAIDNWLRCWFLGIDAAQVQISHARTLEAWEAIMTSVFRELRRVLRPEGHIAFEVGEVRHGEIKLEESVLRCAVAAGLQPDLVLINQQEFTKTSNCWGVNNNAKGTNSNRIVLLRKL